MKSWSVTMAVTVDPTNVVVMVPKVVVVVMMVVEALSSISTSRF
jgi:hypothetical protein